ncbi:M4 family metallopeptidase [Nocardioides agariphilus]|jgi:Zn-dependent metalloprotease|uniref:Neutral metalloproteinase n=1 Tax=Nocardioides agariphilus TaxID=433664 RepID=A0A930VKJ3_9ACTN|nr:M4 family metallopeptidase [Nocardioides agariphilus]MBF4769234.1 M4 family metallopeptidase [Nocardioides agariphilus]
MTCLFVPPYLLEQIARSGGVGAAAARASATLSVDAQLRGQRAAQSRPTNAPSGTLVAVPGWTVHTADGSTTLPGRPVRAKGEPASGDDAVDEAADGIEGALRLFAEVFGRSSFDGAGAAVSLTVHYGRDYDNAFWDGAQLVFGDGDGEIFGRFTRPVDVLGHELTHAVTERSAALRYSGQSGALNESVSDVFGSCLKQWLLGQTVDEADWLIGAGLFVPGVRARGLRDMANPGTAYDDPRLGRDPQGASMDAYVETTDDNGGVHLNSGIANRAFHLSASAIGGRAWEGAGAIWYAALTGPDVGPDTDFAGFAAACVAAAGDHADVVGRAWETVGVTTASGSSSAAPTPTVPQESLVSVRRTGGFAGRTTEGTVDLGSHDARVPEVRELVDRIDLADVPGGDPHPDMFVYDFNLCGRCAKVPQQHLTPDLSRLAVLVLEA